MCRRIVEAFDALPINDKQRKPRVGIVGEILVKYMPLANNHLVELLESEGAEAVVPDLMDFLNYCVYNNDYKHKYLGKSWRSSAVAKLGVDAIERLRAPALEALRRSRRFAPPMPIGEIAELAKPFLSLGNQYGEGGSWPERMAELLTDGTPNIVWHPALRLPAQPRGGKGRHQGPSRRVPLGQHRAVDYDPGASEVNQLNRIKLMLSEAKRRLSDQKSAS
jgi:predicted nucleotide-binding protein (sugar kinase/HSP70/actin superfamily)